MRALPWRRPARFRSPIGSLLTLLLIAAIAALFAWLQPAPPPLSGRANAVDGDTLRIGETRIRLTGIDAVELDQSCTDDKGATWGCGYAARAHLTRLVAAGDTDCMPSGRDRYRRTLAKCTVGGDDLAREMAAAGWALAEFEYASAEAEARNAKRGIWSGKFADPADWRRDKGTDQMSLWDWLVSWFG